jgi:hypothetical protein
MQSRNHRRKENLPDGKLERERARERERERESEREREIEREREREGKPIRTNPRTSGKFGEIASH